MGDREVFGKIDRAWIIITSDCLKLLMSSKPSHLRFKSHPSTLREGEVRRAIWGVSIPHCEMLAVSSGIGLKMSEKKYTVACLGTIRKEGSDPKLTPFSGECLFTSGQSCARISVVRSPERQPPLTFLQALAVTSLGALLSNNNWKGPITVGLLTRSCRGDNRAGLIGKLTLVCSVWGLAQVYQQEKQDSATSNQQNVTGWAAAAQEPAHSIKGTQSQGSGHTANTLGNSTSPAQRWCKGLSVF